MGKKISVAKKQVRSIEALDVKADVENQTLEFSFSSEVPYLRWYGYEIISHKDGDMDLTRLNSGAPLLFNHDWDKQVGVVEKAWIGPDKRGYVKVKFSKSEFAQEKFQDIQDGILKGVSFGYIVDDLVLTKESKEEQNEYTAKTTPFEITVCTVPADITVGIGRAAEDGEESIEVVLPSEEENKPQNQPVSNPSSEEEEAKAKTLAAEAAQKERIRMDNLDAVKAERDRAAAIRALGDRFKMRELADQLINGGTELSEARGAFLEKMGVKQTPVTGNEAAVGMSEKDMGNYSFARVLNALANPNDKKAWEAAKFEIELSQAAAEKGGKAAKGIIVPVDMLRHKRDLSVGTATAGGHTVASDLLAGSFIDLLRKKSVVQRAGAQVLNGLVGNIAIPRQTGAATAYWVGEAAAITESQQAFDQVPMSPKSVGAFTDFSRKLLLQSSVDVENMIRNDLAQVLALEIDRAALYGSGSSNQPTGLKSITGVNTVDLAAYATPTWAEIVGMESQIAADNADVGTMKYLVNAIGRGNCKTTPKTSGQPIFLMENGEMNGYGVEVSNQVAAGDIWFGNFADLILGFWSGLDLLVDPYTMSTSGSVRVVAQQDVDIAARHGESFCLAYEIP
jgi:HK97 family phage major capsid protein/HK97 family phage prohead protease